MSRTCPIRPRMAFLAFIFRERSKQTCLQPDSGVYSIETSEARCRRTVGQRRRHLPGCGQLCRRAAEADARRAAEARLVEAEKTLRLRADELRQRADEKMTKEKEDSARP